MHFEGDGTAAARPVFVDSSGRRGRRIRLLFWALGVLMAVYVATVVLSLMGPPGLSRLAVPGLGPVLPGPGAPRLSIGGGRHEEVSKVLTSPTRTASPGRQTASPTPLGTTPGMTPTAIPTAGRSTQATAAPSPTPHRSPGTTGMPSPAASPTPRRTSPRATPPGQSSSHPTPHSTKAAHASPSPTP